MAVLSFNIIGIGSVPKIYSFQRVLDRVGLNIVVLHETMSIGEVACKFFIKLKPTWKCCGVYANGFSGGLLVAWNPGLANFSPFHTIAGLEIERHINWLGAASQYP